MIHTVNTYTVRHISQITIQEISVKDPCIIATAQYILRFLSSGLRMENKSFTTHDLSSTITGFEDADTMTDEEYRLNHGVLLPNKQVSIC